MKVITVKKIVPEHEVETEIYQCEECDFNCKYHDKMREHEYAHIKDLVLEEKRFHDIYYDDVGMYPAELLKFENNESVFRWAKYNRITIKNLSKNNYYVKCWEKIFNREEDEWHSYLIPACEFLFKINETLKEKEEELRQINEYKNIIESLGKGEKC